MKKNNKKFGPNGKGSAIDNQIRLDIKSGKYAPGDRLPSRADLESYYKAGPVTIQNAFNKLKEDGFIRPAGKKGTFVADYPPCFCNYAVVFPHDFRHQYPQINFYRILADLAREDTRRDDCRFTIYEGLHGHEDDPDYIRLYDDIRRECIAGVIFVVRASELEKTPLFKEICSRDDLMKVAMEGKDSPHNIFEHIELDTDDYVCRVLDYLKNRDVKKLAVIGALVINTKDCKLANEDYIFDEAEKRGIELKRRNFQVRFPDLAPRTREMSELIFSAGTEERPEALWILTDSLVKAATLGLLDAGVKVPEDVIVVSHCNFPKKPNAQVETSWYGFDVVEFIDKALAIMHRQRDGKTEEISNVVPIKLCFND